MVINNAVVFVTGASSGIGEAMARAASRAVARVLLLAHRQNPIEALTQDLGDVLELCATSTSPSRCDTPLPLPNSTPR